MPAQAVLKAPLVAETVPVVLYPRAGATPHFDVRFRSLARADEASYEVARPLLKQVEITGPGLYGSPSV